MSKTVIAIDPVTRLEGHLKVEVQVEDGKVADAWITGGMFRGFEAILRGRNPRDASQIVQRICGVCPVAHATASSMALEALCGTEVPGNGRIARNLMLAGNYLQSNILHFYHLAGQDYFRGPDTAPFIPRYAQPDLRLNESQNTLAVDEYIEALEVRQVCHQLVALFGGRMPHLQGILAGGAAASGNYTIRYEDGKLTVSTRPSGGGGGSSSYSISVDKNIENGSVTVSPRSASSGRTVTITVKADEGYELDELTVTDKNGDEIKLTDKGDGKYTFKMPRSKVTIEASFVEIDHQDTCPAAGFRDVDEDAWYHEAVDYALDNGLMSGVSDREFAPGSTLTRAMVAQMLYSLEGKPAAGRADFADVAEGAWYADAISWAAGEGIVSGYGDTFGPNDPITREQLAAILYRYAQNEGYKTSQSGKGTEGYLDASSISSYAVKAMDWAVNAGLLSGKGNNTLAPTAGATRAEVAQIFMNFCENIAK